MRGYRSNLLPVLATALLLIVGGLAYAGHHEGPSADALWKKIDGYQGWDSFPGTPDKLYEGQRPHGAFLRVYGNEKANANPDELPAGSIIVKENYTPDKKLAAVTVMKKVDGYNADAGDWFWVKYGPDGTPDMKDGKALAGKVGSCIGCHASAKGDDYVYANDE